jgi:hypothetical protein
MKHLIIAATVILLSTSAFADDPTVEQREALREMYDLESIKAHCPFAINFDKIDSDLSEIGMSIADYCPDGRFKEYASPSLNETMSSIMNRLRSDPTKMCEQAFRRYGSNGSKHKNW